MSRNRNTQKFPKDSLQFAEVTPDQVLLDRNAADAVASALRAIRPNTAFGIRPRNGGGIRPTPSGVRPNALAADMAITPADPSQRRSDLDCLHPVMRDAAIELQQLFEAEGLPFRIFESFRSPQRQAWLYAQGRTRSGQIVTRAEPWESYHQYGLAADFVLWLDGRWSWNTLGVNTRRWQRLHSLGRELGLEPLSFEMPHLQVAGLRLADLRAGHFPEGGDDLWHSNLEAAIISWGGNPAAPPLNSLRPALRES